MQFFIITLTTFLVGVFVSFGGSFFGPMRGNTLVEVNDDNISLRLYESHLFQSLSRLPPEEAAKPEVRAARRDETIRELVQSYVFWRQAKQYGIKVPDQQVANSLAQVAGFQRNGAFDPQIYAQALRDYIRLSPVEFEEEQRRSIAFFKLRWLIQSVIEVTDKEVEEAYLRKNGSLKNFDKDKGSFRDQLWEEKVIWSFNQWYGQIGQNLKVKTHFELLEGMR
jgi:hypothetical protein